MTLVDRPKHAAIVKGLNRNLACQRVAVTQVFCSYHAAIEVPFHLIFFRKAEYSLLDTDCPESDMVINALAFTKSISE